jgi:hypothetical protein
MDHKEQHHQHHQKEREEKKKREEAHEQEQEKNRLPIHPAWLFGISVVLTVLALCVWMFLL